MLGEQNSIFYEPIQAVLPAYDNYGNNISIIIFTDGTSTSKKVHVDTFIKKWFRKYRVHQVAQKTWCTRILEKRVLNPIVINEDTTLIPVKYRRPVTVKDAAYGYVRLENVTGLSSEKIKLSKETKVPYLTSTDTLRRKLRDGYLLKLIYIKEIERRSKIYK